MRVVDLATIYSNNMQLCCRSTFLWRNKQWFAQTNHILKQIHSLHSPGNWFDLCVLSWVFSLFCLPSNSLRLSNMLSADTMAEMAELAEMCSLCQLTSHTLIISECLGDAHAVSTWAMLHEWWMWSTTLVFVCMCIYAISLCQIAAGE